MRIGLVRHFKVNHPFPKKRFLSKSDVIQWFESYDKTDDLDFKTVELGSIDWKRCYSSTLIRTILTAKHIYDGDVVKVPELQELSILNTLSGRVRLPFLIWGTIVRIKSLSSSSETISFEKQIVEFVDRLVANNEDDTLVVSHWFVMRVLRKELLKRGYTGDKFKSNEYATLYVYENHH